MIAGLRRAQPTLAARPRSEVVAALNAVVEDWLAPGSPWFARAEALLPEATGFSAEMIRFALPSMLEPLRAPALAALLDDEAAGRVGPPLILHVLPGNLPGLAGIPAALSLAIGSAALLKPGRDDRIFPDLLVQSIAARDPELGAAVAAHYWQGGSGADEELALKTADLTVAAGDDRSIAALAARAGGRFVGHGHRISFAAVGREIVADGAARAAAASDLALDVATWDQRGCLSPQLCFVEASPDAAAEFAESLATMLAVAAERLPPARMTPEERLAVRRLRDEAEWRGLAGEPLTTFTAGAEGAGTVVVEPARFAPSPLHRSVRIMPIGSLEDLPAMLKPFRAVLEGAGLAVAKECWSRDARTLAAAGVHRVCRLGEMQRPPLTWRQGGRPPLADWLEP